MNFNESDSLLTSSDMAMVYLANIVVCPVKVAEAVCMPNSRGLADNETGGADIVSTEPNDPSHQANYCIT